MCAFFSQWMEKSCLQARSSGEILNTDLQETDPISMTDLEESEALSLLSFVSFDFDLKVVGMYLASCLPYYTNGIALRFASLGLLLA